MKKILQDYILPLIISILPIVAGGFIGILMMKYVYIFADVPSGSMLPTLQIGDRLIVNRLEYNLNDPERFDIAVFEHKMCETDEEATMLVKRIIGLPGDMIQIKSGQLYINGELQTESYINEPMAEEVWYNFGPVVVPEDHYFMMGDNRNSSFDSRRWDYKFVSRDAFWGVCEYRVRPKMERIE